MSQVGVRIAPVGGGGQAQWRIGCEHPMVAMAVQPRRGDQGREVVDELQRDEGQRGAPVALGPRQAIDDPLIVDLLEALKGEGRTGTACLARDVPRTLCDRESSSVGGFNIRGGSARCRRGARQIGLAALAASDVLEISAMPC